MAQSDAIDIEVAYAWPDCQELVKLRLSPPATVQQAIEVSGLLQKYPEIDLTKSKVGIYATLCKLHTPLRHKDRVEIYRPLLADPKEVRRRRAAEGKVMKKGAAAPVDPSPGP